VSGRETSGERGPPPSPCFGPHGAGSAGFWMRSGIKKFKSKILESKPQSERRSTRLRSATARQANDELMMKQRMTKDNSAVRRHLAFLRHSKRLPSKAAGGKVFAPMKLAAVFLTAVWFGIVTAFAQTPAPESAKPADAAQLEALAKKIDEQNAKIDALSQEILKLEQQIEHIRPGIMIGENTPSPGTSAAPAMSSSHPAAAGNTHIVARGETLTSIAKMYKVTVDELQQANHIEDGRKLQAGQTIVIPTPSPAAASSSTPTP